MAERKQWKDMSTQERGAVLTLVAVQAVVVTLAQRDLSSRDASEVRGPKLLWRIACLNLLGALAYLVVGRAPRAELAT